MRWRIFTLLLVVAVLLSLAAVPAAAEGRDHDYLALGDSVAFGYNPLVPLSARGDPAVFAGYPEALAGMLDLNLDNASCAGETSSGFISLTGPDNGCRPYRANFPLHGIDYSRSSQSQLDFAVAYLLSHPRTRLITINVGANDLFLLQKACAGSIPCIQNGLPALLATLEANLTTIYSRIRTEAAYDHDFVALIYYALNYNNPGSVALSQALNAVVTRVTLAFGGEVADGFGAFKTASGAAGDPCAAGLLIQLPTSPLTCDIHPSPAGHQVLAQAIADVLGPSLVKKAA